ncbi:MAG: aspartate aminotransferase family protein [Saprospiraceae bacterium]|jgi:acetylornithine/succinyldiaminopimelate/putrescine aminotransferase|nr:aspartate aminotransferase family protein [Saprospiraceae bacterium]MBK8511057.1 aspartate aminotransferase family protein [Saprospiraceae bacterium]MBK9930073.1 aspartate aminotransferase family protein [Saprospiraceae bacterium]MBP7922192.1 aspartate aminotransferase family protein [Saprospiraceae bacterium]MBP8942205.1 aspartate aminotransferase family protein [Saprospiraceae bacterium]
MTLRSQYNTAIAKTSPFSLGLEITSARGANLYGIDEKKYLDFISGIGVSNLGHHHPDIIQAIHDQADLFLHTMVYGEHIQAPQVLLADLLTSQLPPSLNQVYFHSSGTEAIEAAMKLARKLSGRPTLISCTNAYHGSTYGAMSLMSDETKTNPYGPLVPEIEHIVFNDISSLDVLNDQVAAVILEVVQAEAGIYVPTAEFLKALRSSCDTYGILLIIDEIQSAMGRTGSLFAFSSYDLVPDVLVLGKSFGGGLPLSAVIADYEKMRSLAEDPPLTHMTTFGGHPLSCAAGLASLKILLASDIIHQSRLKAERFIEKINHPLIKELRPTGGLWMAIDFQDAELVQKLIPLAQEGGLLIDWFLFNDSSIRIAPPLTITDMELDEAADILINALDMLAVNHSVPFV